MLKRKFWILIVLTFVILNLAANVRLDMQSVCRIPFDNYSWPVIRKDALLIEELGNDEYIRTGRGLFVRYLTEGQQVLETMGYWVKKSVRSIWVGLGDSDVKVDFNGVLGDVYVQSYPRNELWVAAAYYTSRIQFEKRYRIMCFKTLPGKDKRLHLVLAFSFEVKANKNIWYVKNFRAIDGYCVLNFTTGKTLLVAEVLLNVKGNLKKGYVFDWISDVKFVGKTYGDRDRIALNFKDGVLLFSADDVYYLQKNNDDELYLSFFAQPYSLGNKLFILTSIGLFKVMSANSRIDKTYNLGLQVKVAEPVELFNARVKAASVFIISDALNMQALYKFVKQKDGSILLEGEVLGGINESVKKLLPVNVLDSNRGAESFILFSPNAVSRKRVGAILIDNDKNLYNLEILNRIGCN